MGVEERIGEILEKSNTVTDSLRTTTIQEDLFVNGYAFSGRDVVTSLAASNLYIHFDARTATDVQIIFSPLQFVGAEAGPIVVTFYVSPTLAAGGRTPIMVSNLRATSSNVSQSTLEFVAPANVTSPGTKFTAVLVPSNSAGGALPSSGSPSATGLPFEIDPTKDYLLEIDNTNGTDTLFEYNITYFEAPV